MKKFLFLFSVAITLNSCYKKTETATFYMPGEFEPHEAIWFGWKSGKSDFHAVVADMIKGLDGHVSIKIAVDSDSLAQEAKTILDSLNVKTQSIEFHTMPGDDYWIRDHGASFLVNRLGELGAADFEWSHYGYLDWLALRDTNVADSLDYYKENNRKGGRSKVDSLMSVAVNAVHFKSPLTIEGGSIEVNGRGVLIQNEAVTLQRNPGWTKAEIRAEFRRTLGIKKIIWMKEGLAEDEHIYHLHNKKYVTWGTGGHTDEFVRFADANTILLAWIDESEIDKHPLNRITYERMRENLSILVASTDQKGRPFKIVKVPMPEIVERPIVVTDGSEKGAGFVDIKNFLPSEKPQIGDTLIRVSASSYLNFLVSNDVILNASYTKHGTSNAKEDKVKAIFAEVFPGRKQVWIDAMPLNWSGGGIHCSTQQEPLKKKL